MNDTIKRYLTSAVTTFLAVFLTTVGLQLQSGAPIAFTSSFLISLVLVGTRAGTKAVVESLAGSHADR